MEVESKFPVHEIVYGTLAVWPVMRMFFVRSLTHGKRLGDVEFVSDEEPERDRQGTQIDIEPILKEAR
ncbi:MAG: hypothetical protein AAF191_03360, partial [Verrucomicrobiota bacterium]